MDEEMKHGDVVSIGLTTSGYLQIEYWDIMADDRTTSFIVLNKKQCAIVQLLSLEVSDG